MPNKMCILNPENICTGCGECNRCDLDPNKLCDNCMKCIRSDAEYRVIEIDEIITDANEAKEYQ